MVPFVPIEILEPKECYDAVVIDDDPLVEMIWKIAANTQNKKILYFKNSDEFMKKHKDIDLNTAIYIDVNLGVDNLGEPIHGLNVCQKLYSLGFRNLYLATGYEAEKFADVPFIKGVIGKEPVF